MAEGQMTLSTYQQIDACPGRIDALETSKADSTALTEETTARTTADAKHLAALVELIDSGAKNLISLAPNVYTTGNVSVEIKSNGTIDVTLTSGTTANSTFSRAIKTITDLRSNDFILSGCPSGGDYSNGYALYITNDGVTAEKDEGAGVFVPKNTAITTSYLALIVRSGTAISGTLTFKPMVCSEAAWDISQKFVPYCPTLPELYAMIQAL